MTHRHRLGHELQLAGCRALLRATKWQGDRNFDPPGVGAANMQAEIAAVEYPQASAQIGETDPGGLHTSIMRKAGPVIEHPQLKYVFLSATNDFNLTALYTLRDSVLNGIL